MTDTKLRALSAALEYHRAVDPAGLSYPAGMMSGGHQIKTGGAYSPDQIVKTAETFAAFLDGTKRKKR